MGNGVILLLVLLLVLAVVRNGCSVGIPSGDSPNENVVEKVKADPRNDPWLEHVTDWDTWRNISVYTDYVPDRRSSWSVAYEICTAIRQTYARNATDLPRLRIYGTDPNVGIKIDGSKDPSPRYVQLASATSSHDFICGVTPSPEVRRRAKSMGVPVYLS